VALFLSRLKRGPDAVFLPRTFELKPSEYAARSGEEPGDMELFQLSKATASRAEGALRAAEALYEDKRALSEGKQIKAFWPSLCAWVERYYISGDRRFLQAAKLGYRALAEMFEREKDRRERYHEWLDDTHAYRFRVLAYWDFVEEEEDWTDAERLSITQTLLHQFADPVQNISVLQFPMNRPEETPRWSFQNHESGGPVASMAALQYFRKHYPDLEWANEWRAELDVMMARQMRCYSTNENAIGYQFYGLEHIQLYMDYSHDKRWLYGGQLYRLATEHLMKHDNMGLCSLRLGGMGHMTPRPDYLYMAADLYGERKFEYLKPRMNLVRALIPTQPRLDRWVYYARSAVWRSTDPRQFSERTLPVDHIGVKPLFLDHGLYHEVMHSRYGFPPPEHGKRAAPRSRALNKLCFRAGFHPDDDFLVIDGWGARGAHTTSTGNSIAGYSRNRRAWFTGARHRRKEDRRTEINNQVTVKFNGEDIPPSPFTALEYLGDFDATAMSDTLKVDYNRSDWHRRVFQVKNKFFVVIDQVKAKEAGEFDVKTHWHVLGSSFLDGNRVRTRQAGDARFELINVSGHMQRWRKETNHVCNPLHSKAGQMYPFVEPGEKVLSLDERNLRKLRPGESAWSVNAFYSYLERDGAKTFDAKPHGQSGVLLRRPEGAWLVGAGPLDRFGLKASCAAHIFSHDGFSGVGVTDVSVRGKTLFRASEPVGVEALLAGKAVVQAEEPVTIRLCSGSDRRLNVDGVQVMAAEDPAIPDLASLRLAEGRHVIFFSAADMNRTGLVSGVKSALARAYAALPETRLRESEPPMSETVRRGMEPLWSYEPSAPVRDVCVKDLDADGRTETLLALGDGRLVALDDEGKTRFEFRTGNGLAVNCVDAADVRGTGKPDIAIGSDDRHIYLLDNYGRLVWDMEPVADFAGALGDARSDPGRKIVLIKLFDLDGDGKMEVYAGTNLKTNTCGQHLGVDAQGRQIFSGWGISRYHPICYVGRFVIDKTPYLVYGRRGHIVELTPKPRASKAVFEIKKIHRQWDREP